MFLKRLTLLSIVFDVCLIVFSQETTLIIPPFQHSMGYYKANSTIAKMVLKKNVKFERVGGICALKLKQLDDRTTDKDDAILTLFGLNNHQIVYNVGLSKIKTYGQKGKGESPESLYYPTDIAATTDGEVYISDTYNFRVLKFIYDEDSLLFERSFGSFGMDSFSLNIPEGIDYDGNDNLFICDSRNNRIVVIDKNFNPFMIIDNVQNPHSICVVDPKKGYLNLKEKIFLIVSSDRRRLLKLDFYGNIVKEFFSFDITKYKDVDFNFIDYDQNGNIYVTDTINSCIHKFDSDLKYITSFGREGNGKNQFYKPEGISIYRKYGQVFISERTGFQYYWIGVDGYIKEFTPQVLTDTTEGLTISLFTTEQCRVTIEITKGGKIIRELTSDLRRNIGLNYIVWDLKDDKGNRIVENGKYKFKVILEPLYSSRGYFKREFYGEIEKF
ncbi:MAG: NHL repeat-containing protein [candidate division WOR-3 bacterium]